MNLSAPIGVFDSGFGGLTVARAIIDQLPHESIRYIGDTARGPYGPRPLAQVREYSLEILDQLVDTGVKALVIACNSASAATLRDARERYSVPVVEVIHPAARRAAAASRNGQVAVIGTEATITSQAYDDAFSASNVTLSSVACPLFVDLVERGVTTGSEALEVAHGYLDGIRDSDVDTVVLGCTHYPLLMGPISYVLGEGVTLVNSADETAKDLYRVLMANDSLALVDGPPPNYEFMVTGNSEHFAEFGQRFLGPELVTVETVTLR
ncbi:MAG: glutamate racemase [Candidatus Nanopelagicales bacterium]